MGVLRKPWFLALIGLALVVVGATVALALSARSAYAALSTSRADLLAARDALSATDLPAAQSALTSAAASASEAADTVDGPLWDLAAAIPVLGATPAAVQAVATALDQALAGMSPATGALVSLDPGTLVSADGAIDLAALEEALPTLQTARTGIGDARSTLTDAPSSADGDLVLGPVDAAATELSTQLAELDDTLDGAITAGTIAVPLLGSDGPKRYFVAILNPNEARGTGGQLGQYAILRADAGRITVEQVGSNSEVPGLPRTPPELGAQWIDRYEDGPRLMSNFNISPHHPDAALLWLEAWKLKTGETLDGAFSADVVALGDLVTATGQEVPLPDGGSLTGKELTQFAISGIYEKFPQAGESVERKAYQEAVTAAAIDVVTGSPNRTALASALGTALDQRRVQLWSADPTTEQRILDAGIGGSLAVPEGHHVAFAAINSSGSKLDAFLERSLTYTVGRCPNPETGRVASRVDISLTSAIPEGLDVPEYMISLAERGPDGPINSTLAQVYLPLGGSVLEVFVDGESASYQTFREQDRRAVLLTLTLPPRVTRTVTVEFSEPASDGPGEAPQQPLGIGQLTTIADAGCDGGGAGAAEDDPGPAPGDPADDPLGPLVPADEAD